MAKNQELFPELPQNGYAATDKIAVVTGGSRGLGLYCAYGLLHGGAKRVYISSRKADACDEACQRLNSQGFKGKAIALPADVSKHDGVTKLLEGFTEQELKHGSGKVVCDILIANAGATWGAPIENHPESAISKVLELNVKGVFSTIQLFTPLLEAGGTHADPSRVVIMGSVAGIGIGNTTKGGVYGYLASKAAVHHLGKALAVELGPRNITVNMIAPGFIPTKMAQGVIDAAGDFFVESNPRKRLGTSEDIIGVLMFLVGQAGNYVNGAVIPLDGAAHLGAAL